MLTLDAINELATRFDEEVSATSEAKDGACKQGGKAERQYMIRVGERLNVFLTWVRIARTASMLGYTNWGELVAATGTDALPFEEDDLLFGSVFEQFDERKLRTSPSRADDSDPDLSSRKRPFADEIPQTEQLMDAALAEAEACLSTTPVSAARERRIRKVLFALVKDARQDLDSRREAEEYLKHKKGGAK
jgi:hypothetical protein